MKKIMISLSVILINLSFINTTSAAEPLRAYGLVCDTKATFGSSRNQLWEIRRDGFDVHEAVRFKGEFVQCEPSGSDLNLGKGLYLTDLAGTFSVAGKTVKRKEVADAWKGDSDNSLRCISEAESEFGVPAGLLTVMENGKATKDLFGPMGLHKSIIPIAAEGIKSTVDIIKDDACQNYRAAAWLLMNQFGGNEEKDIFTAVNRYYYGFKKETVGAQTKNVRTRYLMQAVVETESNFNQKNATNLDKILEADVTRQ